MLLCQRMRNSMTHVRHRHRWRRVTAVSNGLFPVRYSIQTRPPGNLKRWLAYRIRPARSLQSCIQLWTRRSRDYPVTHCRIKAQLPNCRSLRLHRHMVPVTTRRYRSSLRNKILPYTATKCTMCCDIVRPGHGSPSATNVVFFSSSSSSSCC